MLEIIGFVVVAVIGVWTFGDNIMEWGRPLYVRWFKRG